MVSGKLPRLPLAALKEAVLGKAYRLSLVIVGDGLSRKLNRERRGKNYPTNVLSFPLEKNDGEIFLNPIQIKREQKIFGVPYQKLVGRMFIHSLFHLKGMGHGSRMERYEEVVRARFKL